jgi:hypothetical protein
VIRTRVLPAMAAILIGLSGSVPLAAASTSIQPSQAKPAAEAAGSVQQNSATTPAQAAAPTEPGPASTAIEAAAPAEQPDPTTTVQAAAPTVLSPMPTKQSNNPKADWRVAEVMATEQSNGSAAAAAHAKSLGLNVQKGKVRLILETSSAAAAALGAKGKGVEVTGTAGDLVQVLAAPGQIKSLLAVSAVSYVRPPLAQVAEAVTPDEGVTSTNASTWQARGQAGAGVKVAVIDGGFSGLAAAQLSGDLPASVTSVDKCAGGFSTNTEHGTAVAEIVHKMAPAAQLYLICINTEVDLANAEAYVKTQGIKIVNHSVGWLNDGRGDGSGGPGTPDATVADAAANGILWVNAAGNAAQEHWSGTFVDSGYKYNKTYALNLFSAKDHNTGNGFWVSAGWRQCAFLKWDNWPRSAQDYNLLLVNQGGYVVAQSTNLQTGTQAPVEQACYANSTTSDQWLWAMIYRRSATKAPRFDLFVPNSGGIQYQTAAGSLLDPAPSPKAFAVGAACWGGTAIESFSSRGPTISGVVKPDITGPDGVSTATYGAAGSTCGDYSNGFFGTSAGAPHLAGAAALVKGANPSFTAAQIQSYLQTKAQDLGTAGKDNTYGSGLLHLPTIAFVPVAPSGVSGVGGVNSATISWTAPTIDSGSPITGYTVTSATPDTTHTCTWTSGPLSCTVNGLLYGVSYTFTVKAINAVGAGPASDPSAAVLTIPGPPLAPTGVTATRGDMSATVSWTAADSNGSTITLYTVTSSDLLNPKTCVWTSGPLSCTVTGLTNGTAYTFTVTAENGIDTGPESAASNSVTPAGVPTAPTGATATPYHASALVSWTAADPNGSPITSYTVTPSADGVPCTWTSGPLSCTVTGLIDTKPYTFTVTATNDVGTGLASTASAAVLPLPVPDAPANLAALGLDGKAFVSWTAPASNDGTAVTYTVTTAPDNKSCTLAPGDVSCTIEGLTNRTQYTVTVTASNSTGPGPAAAAMVTPLAGATYHAVTPTRLLDTRSGNGLTGPFTPSAPRSFLVWTRGGVPANAVAVTGNLTVTGQTSAGFLSLGPASVVSPTTSTLNFPMGDTRANGVTVRLSNDGKLWVTFIGTAGKTAQVLFDVTGYFMNDAGGATYTPVNPQRLLDTRSANGLSGPFTPSVPRSFVVWGRGNVPTGATAVTGNLTVTGQTSAGFLSLGPASVASPTTSTLNFPLGDTRANGVTVKLSADGRLWVTFIGTAGKTAQVLFDVTGYFTNDASGATYTPLTPNRLLDTRSANGLTGPFAPSAPRSFQVTTRGVPVEATAVTGNLTVTGQTSAGFLSLGPALVISPTTSTLNFPMGDTRANGVTVKLSDPPDGKVWVTFIGAAGKTAQVLFDVTGYFTTQ